jgi:uncharacterized Fe-S cluster-containing protein
MRGKRRAISEDEFTDAELDLYGEFSEAARDGKSPDIEEYLRRMPESADKLRPDLEAVVKVCAEIRRLKDAYPNVDLAELLDPGRRARRK